MMTLVEFLILSLATWRFASLLVSEDGPFDMFEALRKAAGVTYDEYGDAHAGNELAKLFTCVWCASVWVGFGVVGAWSLEPGATLIFCLPFALSTVAIVIQEKLDG